MNRQEVLKFLARALSLTATSARQGVTEADIEAWTWVLGAADAADVAWALERHVEESRYFPAAADILGRLRARGAAALTGDLPDWSAGWDELQRAVQRVGQHGAPKWSHAVVEEAVARLGYRDYCVSPVDEQATWRAQYRQIHEQVAERVRRGAQGVVAGQIRGGAPLRSIEASHEARPAGDVVRELIGRPRAK